MKKQIVALSCALALGAAGAAWTPASTELNQQAQPTGQVGYLLSRNKSSLQQNVTAGGGAAAGGKIGEVAGRRLATARAAAYTAPRVAAGTMSVARAALLGARIGAIGGFAGLVIGAAAGAA